MTSLSGRYLTEKLSKSAKSRIAIVLAFHISEFSMFFTENSFPAATAPNSKLKFFKLWSKNLKNVKWYTYSQRSKYKHVRFSDIQLLAQFLMFWYSDSVQNLNKKSPKSELNCLYFRQLGHKSSNPTHLVFGQNWHVLKGPSCPKMNVPKTEHAEIWTLKSSDFGAFLIFDVRISAFHCI